MSSEEPYLAPHTVPDSGIQGQAREMHVGVSDWMLVQGLLAQVPLGSDLNDGKMGPPRAACVGLSVLTAGKWRKVQT